MKKSRFTGEQIVFALRQVEPGTSVPEVFASRVSPMPHSVRDATNTVGFPHVN